MVKQPRTASVVEVTFLDGEVKHYVISASPSVGGHLAREAGQNGVLSMFNLDESYAIPMANIREWRVLALNDGDPK